jgi:hypothetical protein
MHRGDFEMFKPATQESYRISSIFIAENSIKFKIKKFRGMGLH